MMFRYFVTTTAVAAISLCLGPVSAGAVVGSAGSKSLPATHDIVLAQGDGQQQGTDGGQQGQKKKAAKKKVDPTQKKIDQYKKYVPQQYQQYMPGGGGAGGAGGAGGPGGY